jgi:hypothetical protein
VQVRTRPVALVALVAVLVLVVAGRTRLPWVADAGAADDTPPPQRSTSSTPLGVPAPSPGVGAFTFGAVQVDGTTPVTYDPCRPIPIVVSSRAAPPGADRLLADAQAQLSAMTGLQLVLEGGTDERPSPDRPAYQPGRYGERWAPVLVAWTDPSEMPVLGGEVAGEGGSTWSVAASESTRVYVTGQVALDGPDVAALLEAPDGWAQARALVMHELGHVVGLGHVEDPRELMFSGVNPAVTDFGTGDRTGLAALGAGPCVAEL